MYHTGGLCVHVVILGELLKSPVFQRSDDPHDKSIPGIPVGLFEIWYINRLI